jgi:hypothetical protein
VILVVYYCCYHVATTGDSAAALYASVCLFLAQQPQLQLVWVDTCCLPQSRSLTLLRSLRAKSVPLALLRADVVLHCGLVSTSGAAAATGDISDDNTNTASASWELLQVACSGLPHGPEAYLQKAAATATAADSTAGTTEHAEIAQATQFQQLTVPPIDMVAAAAVNKTVVGITGPAIASAEHSTDEDAVKAAVLSALLLQLPPQAPVGGVPQTRWLSVARQEHATDVKQQQPLAKQASMPKATGRSSSEASARRCSYH